MKRNSKYIFILQCCELPGYVKRMERVRDGNLKILKEHPDCLPLMVVCREEAKEDHIDGDFLVIAQKESYLNLDMKLQRALTYIYENFNFDYLFRLDDDCRISDLELYLQSFTCADICGKKAAHDMKAYAKWWADMGVDAISLPHHEYNKDVNCFVGITLGLKYWVVQTVVEKWFKAGHTLDEIMPHSDDVALSYAVFYTCGSASYVFYKWGDPLIACKLYSGKVVKHTTLEKKPETDSV